MAVGLNESGRSPAVDRWITFRPHAVRPRIHREGTARVFTEATRYARVVVDDDGSVRTILPADHPGIGDPAYRSERDAVARAAAHHRWGDPAPDIRYSESSEKCWRTMYSALTERHQRKVHPELLRSADRLNLPADRIPQMREVSEVLRPLTGFEFSPAAGIVPLNEFYSPLADGVFQATQFVRHHSQPLFSPEPDMAHEIIGHGTMLASDEFAEMYRIFGLTAKRLTMNQSALRVLSRVFWYTMEYGVISHSGEILACGASLLSSYGELDEFQNAIMRPADVDAMVEQEYGTHDYQPVLFFTESLDELMSFVTNFCADVSLLGS
ncbi:phenylalanine 4-monooxygenase [Nocardia sp. NPDC058176]|uniref:phenylalanine 4-monooxygenase n=1 Tax=Nocardia sp. NPDC058176 TaxID=3346368 RepID=UPI0036DB9C0E